MNIIKKILAKIAVAIQVNQQPQQQLLNSLVCPLHDNNIDQFCIALKQPLPTNIQNIILEHTVMHDNTEFLLKALNVCNPNNRQCEALSCAASFRRLEVLKILSPLCSQKPQMIVEAFRKSIVLNKPQTEYDFEQRRLCLSVLLQYIPQCDFHGLLHTCLQYKAHDIFHLILTVVKPQRVANCESILYLAAQNNNVSGLHILLPYTSPQQIQHALHGAVTSGHLDLVKDIIHLYGHNADFNQIMVEAIKYDQPHIFDFVFPMCNPRRALTLFERYEKHYKNMWEHPKWESLANQLREHCVAVAQNDALHKSIQSTIVSARRRM